LITKAHHLLAKRLNKPPILPLKTLVNDLLLEILALLFSEEEAYIASKIPLINSTAQKVAQRVHRPTEEVRVILDGLVDRGVIFAFGDGPERKYLVLPMMPGIFEAFMYKAPDDERTRRFAELFDQYYTTEYSQNMLIGPSRVFRIIPIQESLPSLKTGVLPTENIREVIDRQEAWSLASECACRRQKEYVGQRCTHPKDVCMQFGAAARYVEKAGFGRLVSKQEIMEALDRAEESGLVHFTDNIENPNICCNCCACCCVSLATMTKFNTPAMFVSSQYISVHAPENCTTCGACVKVCPAGALHVYDQKLIHEPWRCIGCGVCVSKCDQNALKLTLRPDRRTVPENYGQLMVDVGNENMRIQKYMDVHMPGYQKSIGNWLQAQMIKFI
jgi:ferredoxin